MLNRTKYPAGGAILVMLITSFGIAILTTARLPLLEQSVCRSYYLAHDPAIIDKHGRVPEMQCKGAEIQADLARLVGWAGFFTELPGLVLIIPYGRLAERTSKKLILSVNTVSYVLSMSWFLAVCYFYQYLNIRMIWLCCLFDIFGGGTPILRTLLYTFIAEHTNSALLSSVYYTLSASLLATKFFGMTLGTFLLQKGIWIPAQVGLSVYSLAIPALLLLPRPLPLPKHGDSSDPLLGELAASRDSLEPAPQPAVSWKTSLRGQLRAATREYRKSFQVAIDLFLYDRLSRLCLTIFLFNGTATGVRIILQQYASKLFHWTLAKTSYVLSFEMFVNSIVLISLPYISLKILQPRLGSTRRADLWVMKASLLLNIVGAFCIGFASSGTTFVVAFTAFSVGAGLYDSLKSFATSFLQKEEITRLYIGISLMETIGVLFADPLWSGIFSFSLSAESLAVGTPFWMCSLLFICAFTGVVFLERYMKALTVGMVW